MKATSVFKIVASLVCLMSWMSHRGGAEPLGTAWTYQGRLIDVNEPADGLYDFQFKVFDAPVAGTQIDGDVNKPDIDVIDGYFTVLLDFGSDVFDGNAVWLEIGVRPGDLNDPNAYTILNPRQEVAPTPYSLYAVKAAGFDIPLKIGDGEHTPMLSNTDIKLDRADSDYHVMELRNNEGASLWGINQDGTTSFGPYTPGKNLHLFGGDQVRMTLNGDTGNIGVGLGPTPPTERLDVAGGNIRVRGAGGYDGAGDSAYLFLGDQTQYIKSEWDFGLTLGGFLAPEALTIRQASGNVGLGTSEPRARLHIADADEAAVLLDNGGSVADWSIGTDAAGLFLIGSGTDTFSATRFLIEPDGDTYLGWTGGNVGVGDLPGEAQAPLHVYSESSEFGMLKLQNANPGIHEASMAFIPGSDATPDEYWIQGLGLSEDANNFAIGRGGPKVVITPEGRVGIGTMDPWDTLTIHDNITNSSPIAAVPGITIGNRGSCSIRMGNDSTKHGDVTWIDPEYLRILSTQAIYFQTGGYDFEPEVMFDASGKVGIGTPAPQYLLDVAGPANLNKGKTGTALTVNGAEAIWFDGTYFSWGYGGTGHYFADKVGIGMNNPGSFMLAVNGDAAKTGSTTWSTLSDARLKTVAGRFERGLAEVMALNPVRYQYRQDNDLNLRDDQEHVGLVAQDVEQVIPEAVTENDRGYLMLNNDPVIMAMLNAIKELKAENDQLRQRLESLEQVVNNRNPANTMEVLR